MSGTDDLEMTEFTDHNAYLSAFLDGELTAHEAEQAEARLQRDQAARDELEQLREVGPLLQSLPHCSLRDGFREAVMERCERESLLPANDSAARPASRGGSQSWGVLVGGSLATAAMLFLALRVATVPENSPEHNVETGPAKTGQQIAGKRTTPSPGNAFKKNSALVARNENTAVGDRRDDALRSGPESLNRPNKSFGRLKAKPGGAPPLAGGFGGGQGAAKGGLLPSQFPQFAGDRMKEELRNRLRIGDVIPYLAVSGNRTAVVEVTVLDVRPAADKLEVLLLENEISNPLEKRDPKTGTRSSGTNRAVGDAKDLNFKKDLTESKDEGRLVAVYVELSQAKLANVMRQLGRKTGSFNVSLRPPVALGDVEIAGSLASRFANQKVTLADAARLARTVGRKPAQPGKGTTKPKRGTDPGAVRKQPQPNKNGKDGARPELPRDDKAERQPGSRPFHLRLDLQRAPGGAAEKQKRRGRNGRARAEDSAAGPRDFRVPQTARGQAAAGAGIAEALTRPGLRLQSGVLPLFLPAAESGRSEWTPEFPPGDTRVIFSPFPPARPLPGRVFSDHTPSILKALPSDPAIPAGRQRKRGRLS